MRVMVIQMNVCGFDAGLNLKRKDSVAHVTLPVSLCFV